MILNNSFLLIDCRDNWKRGTITINRKGKRTELNGRVSI